MIEEKPQYFIKDKPALFVSVCLCVGIILSKLFNQLQFWSFATILVLLVFLFSVIISKNATLRNAILILLIIFIAALKHALEINYFSDNHVSNYLNINYEVEIQGEVDSEPSEKKTNYTYIIETRKIVFEEDTIESEGKIILNIPKKNYNKYKNIEYGNIISINGILEEPTFERNPGEFSYKDYLSMHGIYGIITNFSEVKILNKGSPNFIINKIIIPSRKFVKNVINFSLNGDGAYVLRGLILGDQSMISYGTKNSFINTGTIHVLAVSGSHIVLVIAVFYLFFGLLRFPYKIKIIATIFGIIFYMLLTGSTPSVVRASIMGVLVLVSQLLNRKSNVYNILGVSALIILSLDTKQLFDAGFQLSYAAVFSMIFFYERIKNYFSKNISTAIFRIKIINQIILLFGITLAAQIGTLPLTIYYFEKISIISLFANIIVVPLIAFVMIVAFISILVSSVNFWIGSVFMESAKFILIFIINFVGLMEQVPFGVIETSPLTIFHFLYYIIFIAILLSLKNQTLFRKLILTLLVIITTELWINNFRKYYNEENLKITIMDVGQGDAILIQTPNNKNILIDAGTISGKQTSGEKTILPFLRRSGIEKLDYLFLSHPHADHIGGAKKILSDFKVNNILTSPQKSLSKIYLVIKEVIDRKNILHTKLKRGDIIKIEKNIQIYVLHPSKNYLDFDSTDGFTDLNNSSLFLKLVYGNTSIIFSGDVEFESEEDIANRFGDFLNSDLLKVAHHGSNTSSSEKLINLITPNFAAISVGRLNKFKHPSKIVIERFSGKNLTLLRTDKKGALIFESNGEKINYLSRL